MPGLRIHEFQPSSTSLAVRSDNSNGPPSASFGGRGAFGWVVAPEVRLPASRCQGVAAYQNGPNHISHGSRKAPGIALAESGAVAAFGDLRSFSRPVVKLTGCRQRCTLRAELDGNRTQGQVWDTGGYVGPAASRPDA
jgi:hypothetical protein